jgi:hypothetical protein
MAHVEAPPDVRKRLASLPARLGLSDLVRRELGLRPNRTLRAIARVTICDDTGWVCESHPHRPPGMFSTRVDACSCLALWGANSACVGRGCYVVHHLRVNQADERAVLNASTPFGLLRELQPLACHLFTQAVVLQMAPRLSSVPSVA